jgi:hypothetical protein
LLFDSQDAGVGGDSRVFLRFANPLRPPACSCVVVGLMVPETLLDSAVLAFMSDTVELNTLLCIFTNRTPTHTTLNIQRLQSRLHGEPPRLPMHA